MKKSLLSVCMAAVCATAAAETFDVDGITYQLRADGSGVGVTESSNSNGYSGDITIPATVKNGNVTYKVVAIGKRAFQSSEITSCVLPATVTAIEEYAFNASDLTTVTLGSKLESIGDGAFSVCRSLTTINEIPATCSYICPGAFLMNNELKAIKVSADNEWYKDIDGVVYTRTGKTAVCFPVGYGTELVIPEGVDTIGANFMNTNQSIEKVTFPSTLKYVGQGAFTYCTKMTSNELPEGLETVGANAFSNCRVMATAVPSTVTFIAMTGFNNCYKIKEAYINNAVTLWGDQTFYNTTSMTKLTMEPNPQFVTEVPNFAFQNSAITDITIPEGYTSVGSYTFAGCTKVTSVDLPSTMTTLAVCAFSNVDPDKIICRATTPPEYTNKTYYLFSNKRLDTTPVYVPDESVEDYKSAWMWSFFKNIQPMSALGVEDVEIDMTNELVSSQYYDIQGREVQAAQKQPGQLYIVKQKFSDGSVKVVKQLCR